MPPPKLPDDSSPSTWDFSTVFEFLDTLKDKAEASADDGKDYSLPQKYVKYPLLTDGPGDDDDNDDDVAQQLRVRLGDFGKLWDILGVKYNLASAPTVPAFESAIGAVNIKESDAYTSDGPISYPPSSKTVRWKDDDDDGRDVAETNPDSPPEADSGSLTRNQRKKLNRKLRKAAQSVSQADLPSGIPASSARKEPKDSGDDSDSYGLTTPKKKEKKKPAQPSTPAKTYESSDNNGSHTSRYTTPSSLKKQENVDLRTPSKSGSGVTNEVTQPVNIVAQSKAIKPTSSVLNKTNVALRPAQLAHTKVEPIKSHQVLVPPATDPAKHSKTHKNLGKPDITVTPSKQQKGPTPTNQNNPVGKWPIANPSQFTRMQAVQPPSYASFLQSQAISQSLPHQTSIINSVKRQAPLTPIKHQSSIDRNWSLLLKLMHNFPEDKSFLLSPLQLSINQPQTRGIHVFVDASNILIGFQNHLKRARGLPLTTHVPPVDLNFHALALLLERRRPVAKRVLAGSTPEIPAFEAARQVGYETNILDKVWKAKEMTERQRFFASNGNGQYSNHRRLGSNNNNTNNNTNNTNKATTSGGGGGYQSESDSAALFGYASNDSGPSGGTRATEQQAMQHPHKWVEQAVDEILHLKILESIIDTPPPPSLSSSSSSPPSSLTNMQQQMMVTKVIQRPTMILATGDAAEAEYSSGFLKMVQRALSHGWNVEVVAWAENISMGYRRLQREADRVEAERGERRFRIIELDAFADELFDDDDGSGHEY